MPSYSQKELPAIFDSPHTPQKNFRLPVHFLFDAGTIATNKPLEWQLCVPVHIYNNMDNIKALVLDGVLFTLNISMYVSKWSINYTNNLL